MSVVHYELVDSVAHVRMDDGKANALSYEMLDALDVALTRAEAEATAIVVTGREGRFSAGFDLKEMMASPERARALVTRGGELFLRYYASPIPVVMASSGHALAGGALFMLTGDVRLLAEGAYKVGLNEVQIGMPVPILAMELARDRLQPQFLTRATLFAEIVDPAGALEAGWVDAVVSEPALSASATGYAKKLGQLPREAYAKTKLALRERMIAYVRESMPADMARLLPPKA